MRIEALRGSQAARAAKKRKGWTPSAPAAHNMPRLNLRCPIAQYDQRLFPPPLRHTVVPPKFSDEEALPLEIIGEYLGLETDQQMYRYFHTTYD